MARWSSESGEEMGATLVLVLVLIVSPFFFFAPPRFLSQRSAWTARGPETFKLRFSSSCIDIMASRRLDMYIILKKTTKRPQHDCQEQWPLQLGKVKIQEGNDFQLYSKHTNNAYCSILSLQTFQLLKTFDRGFSCAQKRLCIGGGGSGFVNDDIRKGGDGTKMPYQIHTRQCKRCRRTWRAWLLRNAIAEPRTDKARTHCEKSSTMSRRNRRG